MTFFTTTIALYGTCFDASLRTILISLDHHGVLISAIHVCNLSVALCFFLFMTRESNYAPLSVKFQQQSRLSVRDRVDTLVII